MHTARINAKIFTVKFEKNSVRKGLLNENKFEIDIIRQNPFEFHLIKDSISYRIQLISVGSDRKETVIKINGNKYEISLKDDVDELIKNMGFIGLVKSESLEIKAPMPGMVTRINFKEGDLINKGDVLIVLEAMKMENNIKSNITGKIKKICCKQGKPVEKNEVLTVFE